MGRLWPPRTTLPLTRCYRHGLGGGKRQDEACALAGPGSEFDLGVAFMENGVGDDKPQTGAFLFNLGGKKRIEDGLLDLFRDAVAGDINNWLDFTCFYDLVWDNIMKNTNIDEIRWGGVRLTAQAEGAVC